MLRNRRGRGQMLRGSRRRRGLGRGKFANLLNTDSGSWQGIGARLTQRLQPSYARFDLFDKEIRAQTVRNYILNNNGLQNLGTGLKKANGSQLIDLGQEIKFPSRINSIFAISIRHTRFQNLLARMGPWERHVTLWPGTNGEQLNKDKLIREGVVAQPKLKRGEIGCYDSHYRLWRHMSDTNIPNALILEDDADLNYGHDAVNRLNQMFSELDRHGIGHDLVYVGHNVKHIPKKRIGSSIGTPGGCQGLFMYYLTLEGARKLLQGPIPMKMAVDDYVYFKGSAFRQFTLEPRLAYVVNIERSDTAHIH